MPLKWVSNAAETTLNHMTDILDFVQQSGICLNDLRAGAATRL
jgi:hypothetical protein